MPRINSSQLAPVQYISFVRTGDDEDQTVCVANYAEVAASTMLLERCGRRRPVKGDARREAVEENEQKFLRSGTMKRKLIARSGDEVERMELRSDRTAAWSD